MLVGDAELAQTEEFKRHADLHAEMLAAFRSRNFDKAIALAGKAASLAPEEIRKIYDFYLSRFSDYVALPLDDGWSPILRLEEK
jgi:adenylate cyclase